MFNMPTVTLAIIIVLMVLNIVAFCAYGIDKYKARHTRWRISETTLLLLAVMGGSVGAWMGMKFWHHKTMHKKFKYGLPLIMLVQIMLAACILKKIVTLQIGLRI